MKLVLFSNSEADITSKFNQPIIQKGLEAIYTYDFSNVDVIFVVGKEGADLTLDYATITKLWHFVEAGGILFGEAIDCMNFPASRLFGFQQDYPTVRRTSEKLMIDPAFLPHEAGAICEWGGSYQKGFAVYEQQYLHVGTYIETHKMDVDKATGNPALTYHALGKGKAVYAAFSFIGASDRLAFRPLHVWDKVMQKLIETEGLPLLAFPKETITLGDRTSAEAIMAGANWFMESGIMPKKDGREGIFENIHSVTGKVRQDFRPDCHAHTAFMFHLHYEYTQDTLWLDRSNNLMNYLFEEGYQDMEEDSPTYGFWKWFKSPAAYPGQIFTDDNAWVSFVLLYLFKKTGKQIYKERGLLTAKGLLETQHDNGLRPIFLRGEHIHEKGRRRATLAEEVSFNPHFESIAHAAYIQAYIITGDKQYLETAYKGTKYLLANQDKWYFMYSKTSGYTRFLFVLGQLNKYYDDPDLRQGLKATLAYLKSAQHESGGVEERDNPDPNRFGKEDTGVFRFNGEGIGDFLYTNNFLLMNLWEVWKAIGDKDALAFYHELRAFVSYAQIKSIQPTYNGAWMRAFDLDKGEYFGNNGDIGWGPYVIEGGWTNALTTAGLILGEIDETLFAEMSR